MAPADPAAAMPGGPGPDPRDGAPREWDNRDRDNWATGTTRTASRARRRPAGFPGIPILVVVAAIVIGGLVGGLDIYGKYQFEYDPADYAGPAPAT